jgi:hypothetical protein
MFKNTTRRGLAIASALSLAFAGLAAAPAQADVAFELKASAGTSYTTFVTEDFTLETVLGSANPTGGSQLKYKVTKATGFAVDAGSSTVSSVATTSGAVGAASTSVVIDAVDATQTSRNYFKLAVAGATTASASVTVTVTAWIDIDNDGAVDAAEPQSAQTVSFKKYSDVASVVTVTQPAEGDTSVKATASFTGINEDQLTASEMKVTFAVSGSNQTAVAATDGVFSSTITLAKDATVSATVGYKGTQVGAASATLAATNKTVLRVTTSGVVGANLIASGSDAVRVRLDSPFAVKAVVSSSASGAVAVAGAVVSVQVSTSATLTTSKTLTVNGTAYSTNASLPTLSLTSDANGEVLVNVTPAGFSTSDTVTFIVKSQNNTTNNMVAHFEEAAWTVTSTDHGYLKTTLGASFNVTYEVKDQWDALTSNAYRVAATYDGTTKYVNLSAGKAVVAFTATSSNNVSANVTNGALETQNATTLNWGDVSGATTASAIAVLATSVADAFDTNPAATTSATISRVITTGDIKLSSAVQLTGSVNHAGATVTVTGTGVKFAAAGDKAVSEGSITLNTDANGHFTVSAYIHTAGKTTVTYTVGAATKSTEITVAAAAMTEGKDISVVVVSGENAAPGSTVRAKVVLKDEYGNPVAAENGTTVSFGVAISGPGFIGTLPTKTGTDGESAEFSVLLGSGDTSGTLAITATYDADATGTGAAISVVKAVTIGAAAASADQKLTVGSFKGFVAIYTKNYTGSKLSAKVAGKWLVVNNLSSFTRTVRLTGAGYTIKVDLYIDGAFVRSETVVTK